MPGGSLPRPKGCSSSAQVQQCPQANQEKSNPGNALEEAGRQDVRELAADQDSEQARKGEGPGRGDKHPEATQAWVCCEEQRCYLGFVAEFRQEDGHKNGPQPHHSLPFLLKTSPIATAGSSLINLGPWNLAQACRTRHPHTA